MLRRRVVRERERRMSHFGVVLTTVLLEGWGESNGSRAAFSETD